MANKLRCAIVTDDGRPEVVGAIVRHNLRDEAVENNGNFTLKFKYFYSIEAMLSGKERLKDVVNLTGYDITQRTFNAIELGITENSERLMHDLATSYLEEIFGYWNVENLQYGKYLESESPVSGRIIEKDADYSMIRLQVSNTGNEVQTMNVGYTDGGSEIAGSLTLQPGESSEFTLPYMDEDIWVSGTVTFKAKLVKIQGLK